MAKKCLVLLSGGQDSTTCLWEAISRYGKENVSTISFDYGQRHAIELQQAVKIAEIAGVSNVIKDIKGLLSNSTLTSKDDFNAVKRQDVRGEVATTFIPSRNMLFLTVAAGEAFNNGVTHIVTGVCEADDAGYPDCRASFIAAMEVTINLALDPTDRIKIVTPLIKRTKAETWKMAKELGCLDVVINESHTDYEGDHTTFNEWGYGRLTNAASQLRAKSYYEAKAKGWV